jgi:hypothetical protein
MGDNLTVKSALTEAQYLHEQTCTILSQQRDAAQARVRELEAEVASCRTALEWLRANGVLLGKLNQCYIIGCNTDGGVRACLNEGRQCEETWLPLLSAATGVPVEHLTDAAKGGLDTEAEMC